MKQKQKRKPKKVTKRLHKKTARQFKLAILPHAHNNYQPHLIGRCGLTIVLVVVIAIQSFFFIFQNNQILGDKSNTIIAQLLKDTNKQRAKSSLKPLNLDDTLTAAAKNKAKDMLSVGYWAHDAPNGTTPWKWIENEGYRYSYAGENLARGFSTSIGVIDAWMESPTHRENVLGKEYTDVGFAAVNGVMDGKDTTLIVALYARPVGAPNTGGDNEVHTMASQTQADTSLITKLQRGMESFAPSLIITLIILSAVAGAALLAHAYRRNLPERIRNTWYRHHGLYKIGLAVASAFYSILAYGGGMI